MKPIEQDEVLGRHLCTMEGQIKCYSYASDNKVKSSEGITNAKRLTTDKNCWHCKSSVVNEP